MRLRLNKQPSLSALVCVSVREMNDSVYACGKTNYELIKNTPKHTQSIHIYNNRETVSFDLEIGRNRRWKREKKKG